MTDEYCLDEHFMAQVPEDEQSGERPYTVDLVTVPQAAPDGTIQINASKYARSAVLTAFEMIGGTARLAEWANNNPSDFFTKVFTKTIQKDIEVGARDDVEGLLERLDLEDSAPGTYDNAIDAEYEMIGDTNDKQG